MDETPVGKRIRAARGFGWFDGRNDFAKAIGLSPATQQRIEREDREFEHADKLIVADKTGAPMWFLEGGWENYPGASAPGEDELPPIRGEAGEALEDLDSPADDEDESEPHGGTAADA